MEFRYKTNIVESFLGDCLVITDTTTNKNIELMRVQANSILKRFVDGKMNGTFPHADYIITDEIINIYHGSDSENHDIEISVEDLFSILKDDKGVQNSETFIRREDII